MYGDDFWDYSIGSFAPGKLRKTQIKNMKEHKYYLNPRSDMYTNIRTKYVHEQAHTSTRTYEKTQMKLRQIKQHFVTGSYAIKLNIIPECFTTVSCRQTMGCMTNIALGMTHFRVTATVVHSVTFNVNHDIYDIHCQS